MHDGLQLVIVQAEVSVHACKSDSLLLLLLLLPLLPLLAVHLLNYLAEMSHFQILCPEGVTDVMPAPDVPANGPLPTARCGEYKLKLFWAPEEAPYEGYDGTYQHPHRWADTDHQSIVCHTAADTCTAETHTCATYCLLMPCAGTDLWHCCRAAGYDVAYTTYLSPLLYPCLLFPVSSCIATALCHTRTQLCIMQLLLRSTQVSQTCNP
jgi:hypothetical protein